MTDRIVVGLTPWLPWPLSGWAWWTEPVRAERLAALRIGVGLVLVLDVLGTYLPYATDFFGPDSLGSPEVFARRGLLVDGRWSLLRYVSAPPWLLAALWLWAGSALSLTLGIWPRLSAALAWALSVSVLNLNFYLHNSGDIVRTIMLFYLMLCPCGAVWTVGGRKREGAGQVTIYVQPWPLRLLFLQLVLIYFFNGVYKWLGAEWHTGNAMHTILTDLAWTRVSYAQLPIAPWMSRALSWTTLFWELGFPVLVLLPSTRTATLWLGVAFHVGTAALFPLGPFPLYMLCMYLPLVPWERFGDRHAARRWS